MRADQNGEIPFLSRWSAYEESTRNLLDQNKSYPVADWIEMGPTNHGGRMLSHAFDPTDSQIIWAGSASGGLWRTTNGAELWEPMTDNLPSLAVGAVAIHPLNPDTMLIGTGEAYGGFFMLNGIGILKSTDRGLTWDQTDFVYQQSQNVSCFVLKWDPVNPQYVYAGTSNGLWRSTDGGDTWTRRKTGGTTAIVINKQSPNIVYTVIKNSGFFKSTDHGETWDRLLEGLPAAYDIGFTSMAICDSFPQVLYAGVANPGYVGTMQGFYKTSDGGENWTLILTPDFYCHLPPWENICQGWYDNVTAVSPADTNFLFANGIELYRSFDGGETWDNPSGVEPNSITYVDHHSFGFDPEDPNTMYAFDDAGVFKSIDGGTTWVEKNNGLAVFQFYSIASSLTNPDIIMGGGQDIGTYYSNNAGGNTEWNTFIEADGGIAIIDHTNPQIMYGEQQFGYHVKSTNGGQDVFYILNGLTETGPFIAPTVMDPNNSNILYTASDNKIYKTTNGGQLWVPVRNLTRVQQLEIDKVNSNIVYAAVFSNTGAHSFWKSENAGTSWEQVTSPGWRVTDIEASPTETGVMYATQNSMNFAPKVYKSINFGASWENITGNLPNIGINAICINQYNTDHLYLATDLGVYASINDGAEWFEFGDGLPNVFTFDIHIHPADTTVRAGTHGRGMWKTRVIATTATGINDDKNVEIPDNFTLFQNFPNPFNPSTNIKYELSKGGNVSIKVFNELGQEVVQLFEGSQAPGEYSMQWNGKNKNGLNVASGIYFCRLSVDNIAQSRKMVLVR